MAQYTFIKEHTAKYRVWNVSVGTSSAVEQSVTFKVGDTVDGTFVPSHEEGGGVMAPFTMPDAILIANPMVGKGVFNGFGAPTRFSIPPSELKLVSDSIKGKPTSNAPASSSPNTGDPNKKIFTTQNIVIGLLAIGVVVGILKWKKVF